MRDPASVKPQLIQSHSGHCSSFPFVRPIEHPRMLILDRLCSTSSATMEIVESWDEPTKTIDNGEPDNVQIYHEEEIPPDKINWPIFLTLLLQHFLAVHAIILVLQGKVLWSTIVIAVILGYAAGYAITVGGHRLYAHRSYKAKWPLRLLLVLLQVQAFQGTMWQWVAWHRAHHKNSEKRLDPHNATKGFFYAHIGWLLTYDPERFRMQLKTINMDDVEADPIVMWQERYYDLIFLAEACFTLGIPCFYFGESFWTAFIVIGSLRVVGSQHFTFLVNSAAHLYGYKPYDKNIYARENILVAILSAGEGWHNYHHTFPWDYRTAEYGGFYRFNIAALLIDFCAKIGWAYDLKTASPKLVAARMKRTG